MATSTNSATGNLAIPVAPKKASPWRIAWRVVRWISYGYSLITLIMMLHKVEVPAIETSPETAARVEEKFAQVERSVLSGHEATLRLDETELNSFLGMYLDMGSRDANAVPKVSRETVTTGLPNTTGAPTPAPSLGGAPTTEDVERARSSVRDVKIQLIEDRAKAYVLFNMLGKDMTLQLEGRLGTTDGYIRFEPVSGQIGSLSIPLSAMQSAVKHLMESPVNRERLRLPVNIADLKIENGEVVATYR
jgi:hypothetical protein